jgi:dihydrofolate synthase/folylpolyglutamate synthase
VVAKEGRTAADMAAVAREAGFHGEVHLAPDPDDAIALALNLADPDAGDAVLVTGSLYLVGNVRERWYATADIVMAQSSWPLVTLS